MGKQTWCHSDVTHPMWISSQIQCRPFQVPGAMVSTQPRETRPHLELILKFTKSFRKCRIATLRNNQGGGLLLPNFKLATGATVMEVVRLSNEDRTTV